MNSPLSLSAIFFTSLLGSLHCIGMCGGFVTVYCLGCSSRSTATTPTSIRRESLEHLGYNLGRLLSYLTLGAVAGAIGETLESFQLRYGIAATLFGAIILVWGAISFLRALGVRFLNFTALTRITGALSSKIFSTLQRIPPPAVPFTLGALTGALPCGWLYMFVATAASTGSPIYGTLVMFVFWCGTVPAMLSIGFGVKRLAQPFARYLPITSSIFMIVIGLLTITGKFRPELSLVDHSNHHGHSHDQGHTSSVEAPESHHHHHH